MGEFVKKRKAQAPGAVEKDKAIQEVIQQQEEAIAALRDELWKRDTNKPFHVAVIAEDFNPEHAFHVVTNIEDAKENRLLPQIKVFDMNGSEIILPIHQKVDPGQLRMGRTAYVNNDFLIVGLNGYYQGGDLLPFERMLEDGRLVLKGENSQAGKICRPGHQVGNGLPKPGDLVRYIGDLALENVGQKLNLDAFLSVPLTIMKRPEEMVGARWHEIFHAFERKIHLLQKRSQNNSQSGRRNLNIALWGGNGNGKTSGAMVLIGLAARKFGVLDKEVLIIVKAGEIISKWVGETENNISNLFNKLREIEAEYGFGILMIDEFDALCHNTGGMDSQSSWIETSIVPQWKTELQGPVPLKNTLLIVTLNNKKNIDAAVLRRFWDVEIAPEIEAVPALVEKVILREIIADQEVETVEIAEQLLHFLKTQPLGRLEFSTRHFRDFYPVDIMSYADIESICQDAVEVAECEDRKVSPRDVLEYARNLFFEKAKRIRVGNENGIRRSNARDYFHSLSDEEFIHLDRVVLTSSEGNSGEDEIEDL